MWDGRTTGGDTRPPVLRVLTLGASNNGGSHGGGADPEAWDVLDPRIYVWNNSNDTTLNQGTDWIWPVMGDAPFDRAPGDNESPCVWMAQHIYENAPDDYSEIRIINCTKPGGIGPWAGNGETNYDLVESNALAANPSAADVLVWIQGGSDAESETPGTPGWDAMVLSYQADFATMIADLKGADALKADARIVIVGLSSPTDAGIAALRGQFDTDCLIPLAAATTGGVYVSSVGVECGGPTDEHHSPAGYVDLGERIGAAIIA